MSVRSPAPHARAQRRRRAAAAVRRGLLRRRSATRSPSISRRPGDGLARAVRRRRLGVISGPALGYVLGGVLGRSTADRGRATEAGAARRPGRADRGRLSSAPCSASWSGAARRLAGLPDRPRRSLAFPLFAFVLVALGLLGYRVGRCARATRCSACSARGPGWPTAGSLAVALPRIIDTSVAIDGRILDVVRAGFLHGTMLRDRSRCSTSCRGWPTPVTTCAAAKGRRGLEVLETLRREPGVERRGARRRGTRRARGRRQARADLPRPRRRAAHPGHQPGQGRRARRRPGPEPARARARPAAAGRAPATRSRAAASRPARSPARRSATSTTARWSWSSGPGTRIGQESLVQVTSVLTTANGRMVFARPAARVRDGASGRPPVARPSCPRPDGASGSGRGTPRRCACSAASRCSCTRCAPSRPARSTWWWSPRRRARSTRCARCSPDRTPGAELAVVDGRRRPGRSRYAWRSPALPDSVQVVLVHDAARPLVPRRARRRGGRGRPRGASRRAGPARGRHGQAGRRRRRVVATLDRVDAARGPDAAGLPAGRARRRRMPRRGRRRSRDRRRGLVERLGVRVLVVPGAEEAFKVTRPLDLVLAEAVLGRRRAAASAEPAPGSASASTCTRSRTAGRCGWPGCTGRTSRPGCAGTPTVTSPRTRPATHCCLRPGSATSAACFGTDRPEWAGASGVACSPRPAALARRGSDRQRRGAGHRRAPDSARAGRRRRGAVRDPRCAGVGRRDDHRRPRADRSRRGPRRDRHRARVLIALGSVSAGPRCLGSVPSRRAERIAMQARLEPARRCSQVAGGARARSLWRRPIEGRRKHADLGATHARRCWSRRAADPARLRRGPRHGHADRRGRPSSSTTVAQALRRAQFTGDDGTDRVRVVVRHHARRSRRAADAGCAASVPSRRYP